MQSYLQYRNFGRRLKTQLEHNRLKLPALNVAEENPIPAPPTPEDSDSDSNDSSLSRTLSFSDLENASPRLQLETVETQRTTGTQLGISLTGINVRSRKTVEGKQLGKVFVVGYESSEDPMNPHNWPLTKRIFVTANVGLIALVVGTAASIDSAAIPQAAAEFGVSAVTEALATGLVCKHIFDINYKALD